MDCLSDNLTPAENMDRKLAGGYLKTQLWEFQSNHFYQGNPCLYTGEAVFSVIALFLSDYTQAKVDRVNAAIDRMNGIPGLLAQGKSNVRQAPQAWIEQAVDECIGAQLFFNQGVNQLIKDHKITDENFKTSAATAANAFKDFQSYLESDISQHANEQGYACGGEAFQTDDALWPFSRAQPG